MPEKITNTPYPLIDADPYAGRVIRYLRPSDYAVWAGATGAFPAALYLWGECHICGCSLSCNQRGECERACRDGRPGEGEA